MDQKYVLRKLINNSHNERNFTQHLSGRLRAGRLRRRPIFICIGNVTEKDREFNEVSKSRRYADQ